MRLVFGFGLAVGVGFVLAGCSFLLDWNGYSGRPTDGGAGAEEPPETDAGVEIQDARAEAGPASGDASADSAGEGGSQSDAGSCTSSCGGCCDDGGSCVGGQSATTCGKNGGQCQDCTASGLRCSDSVCTSTPPPPDSGNGPTCVKSLCPPLCIPVYQAACCKTADDTCGCQVQFPPSACR